MPKAKNELQMKTAERVYKYAGTLFVVVCTVWTMSHVSMPICDGIYVSMCVSISVYMQVVIHK